MLVGRTRMRGIDKPKKHFTLPATPPPSWNKQSPESFSKEKETRIYVSLRLHNVKQVSPECPSASKKKPCESQILRKGTEQERVLLNSALRNHMACRRVSDAVYWIIPRYKKRPSVVLENVCCPSLINYLFLTALLTLPPCLPKHWHVSNTHRCSL